jgi:hypothetical protein
MSDVNKPVVCSSSKLQLFLAPNVYPHFSQKFDSNITFGNTTQASDIRILKLHNDKKAIKETNSSKNKYESKDEEEGKL